MVYPSLIDDDEDPIFLRLEWNADGLDFLLEFPTETNKESDISGSSLFLKDKDGVGVRLTILVPDELDKTTELPDILASLNRLCALARESGLCEDDGEPNNFRVAVQEAERIIDL